MAGAVSQRPFAKRGLTMFPQRCPDERPHLAHPVPAAGCITGFTCPGLAAGELDRLLDEAFGPLPARAGS